MADSNQAAESAPEYRDIEVTEEVRLVELGLVIRPGETVSVSTALLADSRFQGKIKE